MDIGNLKEVNEITRNLAEVLHGKKQLEMCPIHLRRSECNSSYEVSGAQLVELSPAVKTLVLADFDSAIEKLKQQLVGLGIDPESLKDEEK